MAAPTPVTRVWVDDIANPGYGPIWAVHAQAGGRGWVLTDSRALYRTEAEARRFAARVQARGAVDVDLWEPTSLTDEEREAYYGEGLWAWEEMEKRNGNW